MLMSANKPQQGFSLVEVLIALVIMSVGMLGIATLFVQGMQAGRTSMFRHNAVILVGDVADRIRANPTAGAAYAGAGVDSGVDDVLRVAAGEGRGCEECSSGGCKESLTKHDQFPSLQSCLGYLFGIGGCYGATLPLDERRFPPMGVDEKGTRTKPRSDFGSSHIVVIAGSIFVTGIKRFRFAHSRETDCQNPTKGALYSNENGGPSWPDDIRATLDGRM